MQDSPDLPQQIAAILRCPETKRTKEQWKCLALFLLDEIQQWTVLTERIRDHPGRPFARLPIESFEARPQPNRRPGAPSKLDKARAKAVRGGDAELNEYIRLFESVNKPEKRPVGHPILWTDKDYRMHLAVVEGQIAAMSSSGRRVTIKEAITRLVELMAPMSGMTKYEARKRVPYLQKQMSVARTKFRKLTDNSP